MYRTFEAQHLLAFRERNLSGILSCNKLSDLIILTSSVCFAGDRDSDRALLVFVGALELRLYVQLLSACWPGSCARSSHRHIICTKRDFSLEEEVKLLQSAGRQVEEKLSSSGTAVA